MLWQFASHANSQVDPFLSHCSFHTCSTDFEHFPGKLFKKVTFSFCCCVPRMPSAWLWRFEFHSSSQWWTVQQPDFIPAVGGLGQPGAGWCSEQSSSCRTQMCDFRRWSQVSWPKNNSWFMLQADTWECKNLILKKGGLGEQLAIISW